MRRLGFLFHLYQPPTQHENVLREIADNCYLPLIKLIKNKKFKVTLNIPLGLLESMDKYGYSDWIKDLKALVEDEKVELIGSAAYHSLLTRLPKNLIEKQIILNEYGLGYYFGKKGGFEGEASLMLSNILGFYSPSFALNADVLDIVSEMGYEWVLANSSELKPGLYSLSEKETKVLAINSDLSGHLETKTDINPNTFVEKAFENAPAVVSVPAEIFGHSYDMGILMLENIIGALKKKNIEPVFVSEYVATTNETLLENLDKVFTEPDWVDKDTEDGPSILSKYDKITTSYNDAPFSVLTDLEELPIWNEGSLEKIEDEDVRKSIAAELDFLRSLDITQISTA